LNQKLGSGKILVFRKTYFIISIFFKKNKNINRCLDRDFKLVKSIVEKAKLDFLKIVHDELDLDFSIEVLIYIYIHKKGDSWWK